jgi:site-specific DNA-methyltransferase (adenine-specific)
MMNVENSGNHIEFDLPITKGQSDYEGWGTALKPANEPICVARKPLSEKTIAENVLRWGTGGINIDGCRVEGLSENELNWTPQKQNVEREFFHKGFIEMGGDGNNEGRFPANFIIDEEASILLDEQSGDSKLPNKSKTGTSKFFKGVNENEVKDCYGDTGGASRFFYVPKVSKKERNMGLDNFEEKEMPHGAQDKCGKCNKQFLPPKNSQCVCEEPERLNSTKKNTHPTIKPINLLTYLVRLITPPNGIVMDCYMGSGSTGIAALLEGFQFIGMEMDEEYFNIAEARIDSWEQYKDLVKKK